MKNNWFKFAFIFLGALVISMSQLKISPTVVVKALTNDLNVDESSIQLLSSVFSLSGIFLAIPGGFIMSKIGARKLAIGLMGCLALGNFLGYFMIGNFTLLLITRMIEGISFAMFLMIAMVYIRYWFAKKGSGTALGIFGVYSALASMIVLNLAVPIVDIEGYRSLWLILGGLSLLVMIIYLFTLEDVKTVKKTSLEKENYLQIALKDKGIWILAVAHAAMTFVLFTLIQILPSLFLNVYNLGDVQANGYASLFGLFGVPTGILAGILIDKFNKPMAIGFLGFILMIVCMLTATILPDLSMIYVLFLFVISGSIGFVYTANMIMASGLSKIPEVTGYNIAIVNTAYYLMIVVGSPITMKVIVSTNSWFLGFLLLAIISIVGLLSYLIFKKYQNNTKKLI